MTISEEQAVRLVEIARRRTDELFSEMIGELRGSDDSRAPSDEPRTDPGRAEDAERWSLGDTTLTGGWEEIGRESAVTYKWPDGNIDEYVEFISYRGTGDYGGQTLALGFLANGDVVGFVLGAGGGAKRGITYFFPTDDFEETREKISMIRGGGPRGRSGFAPGEALPNGYARFETAVLRDRKAGKWNVQAVLAEDSDYDTMLAHTALQARLRGLA